MSIENAQRWLSNHSHLIPALTVNQQEITRLLQNHRHADQVVKVAIRDPGLSLALLIKVNSRRGQSSGREIVESPLAAISLLGDEVCHTLFKQFSLAEKTLQSPHQLFLFQQLINRSLHNEVQAELWADEMGFKNLEPIKVAALLAYSGEVLCCVHDFDRYLQYILAASTEQQAEKIFGFQFPELTDILCQTLNLPLSIIQSLPHQLHDGQTSKLLFHTRQISRFCETGWYGDNMHDAFEQMAEWLQMPLDKVTQKTHQHAIVAAQSTFVPEAWQPASRLILIKDSVWGPHLQTTTKKTQPPTPANVGATSSPSLPQAGSPKPILKSAADKQAQPTPLKVAETIKRLVRQPATSQSDLVNTCLKGLYQELGLNRVCLFLLSQDKKSLHNRLSLGVDQNAALKNYAIDVTKSGLLKALLGKPQAVLINRDNLGKYQQHIPQSLLASIMTDNFIAMSLFIGTTPLGIVYADRSNTGAGISAVLSSQFKQLITLTSKALTLLSKR